MSTTNKSTPNTPAVVNLPNFKDKKLLQYSREIQRKLTTMTDSAKAVAIVLGKVMNDECYKADGYDSVADYAEKVFGIARAQAYKMARTAVRFMLPTSELADNEVIKALPLNNLAELNAVEDDKAIAADIASGKLKADTKQADIRKLADSHKPAKVLKGDLFQLYTRTKDGQYKRLDDAEYHAQELSKALKVNDSDVVVKCDDLKDDKGKLVCKRFVVVSTSMAASRAYYAKVSTPAKPDKIAKAPKSSPVTVTPGDAVAAAVKAYKAAHNGNEPTMAELMAILAK